MLLGKRAMRYSGEVRKMILRSASIELNQEKHYIQGRTRTQAKFGDSSLRRFLITFTALLLFTFSGAGVTHASTPLLSKSQVSSKSEYTVNGERVPTLNPVVIGLCNAGFGETVIDKFPSKHDGEIALKCGDEKNGYVHIKSRHEGSWTGRMGQIAGPWDDFMLFSVKQVVAEPAAWLMVDPTSRCYTAPIQIRNGEGEVVVEFNPTVIVSSNNKKIVTAYPTTRHECIG